MFRLLKYYKNANDESATKDTMEKLLRYAPSYDIYKELKKASSSKEWPITKAQLWEKMSKTHPETIYIAITEK